MIGLLFLLSGKNIREKSSHVYLVSPFNADKAYKTSKFLVNFCDSIPDDTITLYSSEANDPLFFSRNISTGVCFDSLCRLVHITIYWEVFGKYIGYSVPAEEELTKKEHVVFTQNDYARLNEILSDSLSALKYYSLGKIQPEKKGAAKADAVSGATIPNLLPWIVPEAAYTSFTLWHITYGATRDSIVAYSKKNLFSNQLLVTNLQKNDLFTQIKALQWVAEIKSSKDQFVEPALDILRSGNFMASRQALKFLKGSNMKEDVLQKEMILLFENADFRIKNLVIEYLKSCDVFSQSVARDMLMRLRSDDYYQVNVILSLLTKRYHPDFHDQLQLSILLKSKNSNVSNRVYSYLGSLSDLSPATVKKLNRYSKKNTHNN